MRAFVYFVPTHTRGVYDGYLLMSEWVDGAQSSVTAPWFLDLKQCVHKSMRAPTPTLRPTNAALTSSGAATRSLSCFTNAATASENMHQ